MKLPIKKMTNPCKLYNVDRTENRAREVQFFVNLETRMGANVTRLRFFLSNLEGQKAILGYPWFAAVQPRVDWKKGWIDQVHLPVILRAANTGKARFVPRTE